MRGLSHLRAPLATRGETHAAAGDGASANVRGHCSSLVEDWHFCTRTQEGASEAINQRPRSDRSDIEVTGTASQWELPVVLGFVERVSCLLIYV